MVILAALIGRAMGLSNQIYPLLFGLCVPDGPPLGSSLQEKLETVVSGIFMPLLLAYSGMKIDLLVLYDMEFVSALCAIITLSFVMTSSSILFSALLCKVPMRDATVLSLIMSTRGNVQIGAYLSKFTSQTMDPESFTMLILSVMTMSSSTRILVRFIYDYSRTYTGYPQRTILHIPIKTGLRILACAYRPDDAVASLKLLENCYPSKESHVAIYALHLMELVGRGSPLLINHQLGQKSSISGLQSQKIVDVFLQLQMMYQDFVSVHGFTAMSLMKFMHYDICSLAFDKSVSLIILPFHRKWNHLGKLVFDNSALRMVNQQVLEMPPCSVGILIDRCKIRTNPSNIPANSPYNVAVIFLGGDDDREALAYAKRMSKSSRAIQLTVFRLIAWEDVGVSQWDTVLNIEVLKDLRLLGTKQNNINYRQEKVRDAAETAYIVNELKEEYDLIIVGRRHQPLLMGLTEWNELQELGPIGDILASEEIRRPMSVLVIQQQSVKK